MNKHFVSFALLAIIALPAFAADDPTAIVTAALHKLAPNAKIESVAPAPLSGFYAVVADGHPVYVSADGKYLIEGHVYDIDARRNLMDDAMAGVRKRALEAIPESKRITFAPPHPQYRVTVFTDPDCPYCREFHKQIADYNKLGIAVDYVLFPLSIHPGADKVAQTVWCSKDRNAAFNEALAGKTLTPKTCPNPIAEITATAGAIGVNGTPGIFADDGTELGGYLPPQQLAQRLQQLTQPKSAP
ncbi:MAG: DsbC family protein [Xanthomonadaceae bacterium]|nr:DsbC family protein [Xanthomonadaceae bacterium]MDE2084995.1 DsbC family protein [Xanthomonadaceae bacterium]